MNQLYDMDQVLLDDGRIMRVMGTFDSNQYFFGYNVYSPDKNGDRLFRGKRYRKYLSEALTGEESALGSSEIISISKIVEFFDPIKTSKQDNASFAGTIWHDLYDALVGVFGSDKVGILGSALSGLHFNIEGKLKNDVDFFLEGVENISVLRENMKKVREDIGFCDYEPEVLKVILDECSEVYTNKQNTLSKIIDRRWTGMELPGDYPVRNTMRFRDKSLISPFELLSDDKVIQSNVVMRGLVSGEAGGNLYPRQFFVSSNGEKRTVYCLWWKISSPVKDGDDVGVCGDLVDVNGVPTLRMAHFNNHWLHIYN
jgi:hypothetical protein